MTSGIRLYNLFPLLTGSLAEGAAHFPRITGLGFDWVFLNPVHRTGGSRSLYAIASYDEIDPRFATGPDLSLEANLHALTGPAAAAGLGVMLDLVINHTADAHPFTTEKPHWYGREADGRIKSPSAVDPDDPGKVTVWGDLAELDYHSPARDQITAYFVGYVKRLVKLGIRGFRCDAAYMVPADVWKAIVKAARDLDPTVLFAAETLGCRLDQVEALASVGFDYFFNSSKWWDLKAGWAVDQYNQFRPFAPSIAFPESHDTPRISAETADLPVEQAAALAEMRYAMAACFSTGIMLPLGYEYGFQKPMHVVETTPADWEEPRYDISGKIAAINAARLDAPALNVEGEMEYRRFREGAVGFVRYDHTRTYATLFLTNPDATGEVWANRETICEWLKISADDLTETTPGREAEPEAARVRLLPYEYRIFNALVDQAARALHDRSPEILTRATPHADWHADARIAIECVAPQLDGGRFPVKRVVGDRLSIAADIMVDGHEILAAEIVYRQGKTEGRARLRPYDNDRWRGDIFVEKPGRLYFTIEAWIDSFESWRHDTKRKFQAAQPIGLELEEGRELLLKGMKNANVVGRKAIETILRAFDRAGDSQGKAAIAFAAETRRFMRRWGPRDHVTRYPSELEVIVDRQRGLYGAWYEMFQRSQGTTPGKSATFDDCIKRLPEIAGLGFDVVYLVPIHPIGKSHRKGPNNTLTAGPNDPGVPYAIGSDEGGHDAVHPELGTLEDFRRFVTATKQQGMEVALDFAVQCSPDHPWVKKHKDWFFVRPDGTIKYAENPPKKYEDIVNVNFFGLHRDRLWSALRDVVLFWVAQGVEIFRVDNPHTKPLPFWEWLIREVQARNPNVIFLAEAFTRPKLMKALAKRGFSQSYTYFTWRNTKAELTEYLTELTQTEMRQYFRGNFFTNTPDILPGFLQNAPASAFKIRAALAATLCATWGIYNGFELCEGTPVPGKEEYLNSEKYDYKVWDWERPGHIKAYIKQLNELRRACPQLQTSLGLRFHDIADDRILFFSRNRPGERGIVWIAVMLDPAGSAEVGLTLPIAEYGFADNAKLAVSEPLAGYNYSIENGQVTARLSPENPMAVFVVR